jgi:nitroimidazol reductase NimA-like FMN-containing flavoprotein (pyridoxamine 5'-phosphate oxidase superfamily)
MRSNPVVSGIAVIDHGYYAEQCNHLYVSAVFKGRVEFVEDVEEKKKVLAHMIHAQEKKKPGDLLKRLEGPQVAENLAKTAVGRIVIEELTGKKSAEVNF